MQLSKVLKLIAASAVAISMGNLAIKAATPKKALSVDDTQKSDVNGQAVKAPIKVKKTEISNFDFWSLQCDQYDDPDMGTKCAARLPVFKQNSQELLAVLVISPDDKKNWLLKVIIPTSISVVDGGSISFDSSEAQPQTFVIETCEPAACATSVPIDTALLQTMKDSSKVSLSWTAIDHSPVKFDFEIKGIQQTLKALFG